MLRDKAGSLSAGPRVTTISRYAASAEVLKRHQDFLQWDGTYAGEDGRLLLADELDEYGTGKLTLAKSASRLTPESGTGPFCFAQTPLFLDRPEHTRFRRLLVGAWDLGTAERALEHRTASLAVDLLSSAAAAGTAEFMSAVAVPLSATVLAWFFGAEPRSWIDFTHQHAWAPSAGSPDDGRGVAAFQRRIWALLTASTRSPRDDAVSRMTWHRTGEEALRPAEIATLVLQMGFVANESTIRYLGSLARALAADPGLRARTRGNAAAARRLAEDIMRIYPPIRGVFRRTERECAVGGVTVPPGHGVFIDLRQANREIAPAGSRPAGTPGNRGHLSFGTGIHRCPGAALVAMEASALIGALCELPVLRVADAGWREDPNGLLEGPSELWLTL